MNTTDPRLLRVEVVGDLPVLWAHLRRLDLPTILDRHFPAPLHWKGSLTQGEVLAVWLLFQENYQKLHSLCVCISQCFLKHLLLRVL